MDYRYFFEHESVGYSNFFTDLVHIVCDYALSMKEDLSNRIDEMEIYDGDVSAAKQAEKDGYCKLIHDIKINRNMDIYPIAKTIIDTPENRELLTKLVKERRCL